MTAFTLHSHHLLLYSALSSSSSLLLLLISPMFVFCSNSKGFKEFKPGISFSLKSHFHCCYFLFPCSFCLPQFCFIFLVPAHKKDSLSSELIKMFLPWLTSLKYVHVSKQKVIYMSCVNGCWNVSFGRNKKFIFVNRFVESHSRPIKTK